MTPTRNDEASPRRLSDEYDIFGLQVSAEISGWPNSHLREAKAFVMGLTREANGEDGPDFWAWMLEGLVANLLHDRPRRRPRHGQTQHPEEERGYRETLFVSRRDTGRVVGTLSVVADDRGRGAKYGLEGRWLGGFNVLPESQGIGLGSLLLNATLDHLQVSTVTFPGGAIRVNLVTRNPVVEEMVARRGFSRLDLQLDGDDAGAAAYSLTLRRRGEQEPRGPQPPPAGGVGATDD